MKFLIIQFRQIGDVVLTTPVPRMIKSHVADAQVDFLTYQANESLLHHNPYISNVLTFRKQDGLMSFIKLLKTVRSGRYDAVLDFQDTPRSTYVVLFSSARYRVTYEDTSRKMIYNFRVPFEKKKRFYPTSLKSSLLTPFINDLDVYGSPPPRPEIYFSNQEERRVRDLLASKGISEDDFIVTMAPTHRRTTKRWPLDHFYDVARYLIDRYNAKIILSWGPGELDYIDTHKGFSTSRHPNLFSDLSVNLIELAALMSKAKMHVGNDSAPLHIAVSQGLPTFTVFGSTSTGWSYPANEHATVVKDIACQPCRKHKCRFGESMPCLNDLPFADIKDRLDAFVQQVVLG
jgi:ADP-heptose:LPS heptosyltransferase